MQPFLSILRVLRAVVVKRPPRSLRLCVRLPGISFFALFCAFLWLSNSASLAEDAAKPKYPDPARFESEIADFEKWDRQNAVPDNPILFVGSSTIRLWQSADAFPGLPVINRGFGGSTIADVNHFADRIVFKYKPRAIVFYSGDNDIASGLTPDRVFSDFQTFATSVHERLPGAQLIYLAIKPSNARWNLWPKMQEVNARVKDLAHENDQLVYIDTAPPLLGPDAEPAKEFFRDDGLHMSKKGYAAWNKLLAPILSPSPSGRGPG
jgi:lysophospholipase L1-like esterase